MLKKITNNLFIFASFFSILIIILIYVYSDDSLIQMTAAIFLIVISFGINIIITIKSEVLRIEKNQKIILEELQEIKNKLKKGGLNDWSL